MAGDPPKTTLIKAFKCPYCGSDVRLRAMGQSLSAVCSSCQSVIDVSNENYRILSTSNQKKRVRPLIPLGSRGRLMNDLWEVIGFMQRSDGTGQFGWHEYLLYNPYKGFRWLFQFQGQWTCYEMIKDKPQSKAEWKKEISFRDRNYKLFLRGEAKVTFVLGEFYWKVKVGEVSKVVDFICPPWTLSWEGSRLETIWSLGQYLEPEIVMEAFRVKEGFPPKSGIAPNQPSPYAAVFVSLKPALLVLVFALIMIQGLTIGAGNPSVVVADQRLTYVAGGESLNVLPVVEVDDGVNNLVFDCDSDIQNSWIDLDMSLNGDRGQKYVFNGGMEYYSGYDGGEYWSEGRRSHEVVLTGVPGGKYSLTTQISGKPDSPPVNYRIKVTRRAFFWSNFWFCLVLLFVFPLVLAALWFRFELARWSESDYSPYQSS